MRHAALLLALVLAVVAVIAAQDCSAITVTPVREPPSIYPQDCASAVWAAHGASFVILYVCDRAFSCV